ncbi:MAG: hypothetical protein IH897_16495 [Planctomycetes bacterium]|nr:hypothetical protein [Planctomycetota bacterium]
MKLRFNRQETVDVLAAICSVAPIRTTKDILKCVRIEAGADVMLLSATNLELSLRCGVAQVEVETLGKTVVVADSRGAGRIHGPYSFRLDPPRLAVERNATRFGPKGQNDPGEPDNDLSQDLSIPEGLDPEIHAYSPVEMRHKKRGNVLFLDTHAEAMTLEQLGYDLSPGDATKRVPKGTPVPIRDALNTTYSANNKLWTGQDFDPVAVEHQP